MSTEIIKADAMEITGYNLGSLSVQRPADVIPMATSVATPLAKLINEKNLFKNISGKKFVYVEGWTTMGAMLGVVPRHVPELSKRKDDGEYEETVELIRIIDGLVIGRAAAVCGGESDKVWKSRPEYARKSMAITRATGKAFRLSFSWIMTLAGYMPTPAEEMEDAEEQHGGNGKVSKPPVDPYLDKCNKARDWLGKHKAANGYFDLLGFYGATVPEEIPAAKRDEFIDKLRQIMETVKQQKAEAELGNAVEANGGGEAPAEIDQPSTPEEVKEFEEAKI